MNPQVILVVLVVLGLLAFTMKSKKSKSNVPTPSTPPVAQSSWDFGPNINGKHFSVGMPSHPTVQGDGWYFDFPDAKGQVDYVQWFGAPVLTGAKQLVLHYSVTGGGFVPSEVTDNRPATVGLQFQRKGDDWSGKGAMETYRWYSHQLPVLKAGEFTLTVPLDISAWGDVYGKSDNLAAFNAALADISNIAVVFGNTSGAGHGVYATQPSRFTMKGLEVIR